MSLSRFRAWDKENDRMIYPSNNDVYFNLTDDGISIEGLALEPYDGVFPLLDSVLMQSTGLKDKNGVEIFEGDVVKMDRPPVNEKSLFLVKDYVLGKVIFAEVNEFGKDSWSFNGGYTGYSLEVIGNIYENNHLLG